MSPAPEIETIGLCRSFGDRVVVDHLDLSIARGSIFGLLGSNGAGKTTTIKMLSTLLAPTAGRATVAGFDVERAPIDVRRRIGYVPQLLSADGTLTGHENLMLSAKLYGIPRAERGPRIAQALAFMGLSGAASALVRSYSGGMIRRLEIAQSMLHRPRVLFLDEPTVGLDPVARHAVWEKLRELVRELGTTVLLTTHDMEEADELCGMIGIMHQGKLVVSATPGELKARVGPDATLDDVFAHYTGGALEQGGNYRDVVRQRRTARRLGKWSSAVLSFAQQTTAIAEVEAKKLRRDFMELITRAVQPTLWLLVFGQVFSRVRAIPTGGLSYLDFMAPGILAQSVLFTGIFYGIAIIWERDLGTLQKLLVSPAYRGALVLGKAAAAGIRGLAQTVIIYVIALLLGIHLRFGPAMIGMTLAVILGAAVFSTFSLLVACLVKTRERFMGIGQVLTMPLFFASDAIYPMDMMPGWLRTVARANPLSYLVDALRTLMIQGGHSANGLALDFGVLLGALVVLVMITAKLYPTVI